MIYLAHQLDAIGIPGELFLERYADWEVELPNGARIKAITEQGLLSCGYKREATFGGQGTEYLRFFWELFGKGCKR